MHESRVARYLAEFVGTFALILFGAGAAVFTLAPATLGTERVVLVSLSFGFILTALAYALGDISGGHFNPAVTLAAVVSKRMPVGDVIPYLVAQIVGGLAGMGVVFGIVSGVPDVVGGGGTANGNVQSFALASQCYQGFSAPAGCAYSAGSVFLLEAALAFVFIFVILRVTSSRFNSSGNLAPIAIGFTLLVANLVAIPVDGASLNPVRSFSPALLAAMAWPSTDMWALQETWLFWVAPIVGGLLAALAVRALEMPEAAKPAAPAHPSM